MVQRIAVIDQARELHRRNMLPFGIERKMGPTLDFSKFAPSELARSAGRPVARIVELGGPGILPVGFATGFVVAPGLLSPIITSCRPEETLATSAPTFSSSETSVGPSSA
jgi:hypothetical protein